MANYIFGIHAIDACIKNAPNLIEEIYLDNKRNDARFNQLIDLANAKHIPLSLVDADKLKQYDKLGTQKVIAKVKPWENNLDLNHALTKLGDDAVVVILDGITDLHNLGAIIRSCECFGVDLIILPKNNSANPSNPTVSHVSSGALYAIPIVIVNNVVSAIDKLKENGFWICATALTDKAVSLYEFKPQGKLTWVLGSEDKGIRRLVLDNCDYVVNIPMYGVTQSLNVSVSAGVVLNYTKQARYKHKYG